MDGVNIWSLTLTIQAHFPTINKSKRIHQLVDKWRVFLVIMLHPILDCVEYEHNPQSLMSFGFPMIELKKVIGNIYSRESSQLGEVVQRS